jgi:hypothetical protein
MPAGDEQGRHFLGKMLGDAGSDDSDFAGELLAGHRDFLSQWVALARLLCGSTRDTREELGEALCHCRVAMIAGRPVDLTAIAESSRTLT